MYIYITKLDYTHTKSQGLPPAYVAFMREIRRITGDRASGGKVASAKLSKIGVDQDKLYANRPYHSNMYNWGFSTARIGYNSIFTEKHGRDAAVLKNKIHLHGKKGYDVKPIDVSTILVFEDVDYETFHGEWEATYSKIPYTVVNMEVKGKKYKIGLDFTMSCLNVTDAVSDINKLSRHINTVSCSLIP